MATQTPGTTRRSSAGQSSATRVAFASTAVVLVAQLMLSLDTSVVNVALPSIQRGLGFDIGSLSWVVNAYVLAFGGLLLLGGKLGDVFGRRRVFAVGIAIFTVSSLLGGLALSPAWLEAARAVQGAGAALAAPSVIALITANAPDDAARNRGLALFAAFSMGGSALGLVVGGVLTGLLSWRWTLFINVPIGLTVLLLLNRFVTETDRRSQRFDLVGALAAAGAAVSLVFALVGAPRAGWGSPVTVSLLALGVLLIVVLVVVERRVATPLLWLGLLTNRTRAAGLGISMLAMGAQIGMFYLVVQYLQRTLHLTPLVAGVAFLPETIGIFAASRFVPLLMARLGSRLVLAAAMTGLALSYGWFSTASPQGSYWLVVFVPLLLNGLSAGITFTPASALALSAVGSEHAGSAAGLLQTAQQLGGALGLAVLVSVYSAFATPGAFLPGYSEAFTVAAGLALLGLALVLVLVRRARPTH